MNQKTRTYVFIAMYASLSVLFNFLTQFLPHMVNGGTVDLSVIPIFIASYHLGWKKGVWTGIFTWLLGLVFGMNRYMVSPLQILFDYVIPIVVPGIASCIPSIKVKELHISNIYTGVFVTMFLKYSSHVLAGVYFWFPEGSAAGSIAAWIYSAWTYNLGYNVLTLLACFIIIPILIQSLQRVEQKTFTYVK